MEITKVGVFPLDNQTHGKHGLVRINTDEGVYGWGSCYMTPELERASLDYLSELIIGEDSLEAVYYSATVFGTPKASLNSYPVGRLSIGFNPTNSASGCPEFS